MVKSPFGSFFTVTSVQTERRDLQRRAVPLDEPRAHRALVSALHRSTPASTLHRILSLIEGHPALPPSNVGSQQKDLLDRVAGYHIHILRNLYEEKLPGGVPLIQDPFYARSGAWERLAAKQDRADLILTPHPIASAEFPLTLPESLRGGFNAGLVAPHPGPLQGAVVFSSYPFLGSDGILSKERGPLPLDPVRVMALYLIHELGHLLRHWGHAWDHPRGCVMQPALSLNYEAWYRAVYASGPCKRPHPRMKTF